MDYEHLDSAVKWKAVFQLGDHFKQVENNVESSPRSFLHYFQPVFSDNLYVRVYISLLS